MDNILLALYSDTARRVFMDNVLLACAHECVTTTLRSGIGLAMVNVLAGVRRWYCVKMKCSGYKARENMRVTSPDNNNWVHDACASNTER